MKRPVFIIVGTILVFILLGVWLYILFFTTPPDESLFSDLDFPDTGGVEVPGDNTDQEQVIVDVEGKEKLRQLTTKPTVGSQEVTKITEQGTTTAVLYIEAGTGHIFSIDLDSGKEHRISRTTIGTAWAGAITPDGKHAMIQSGVGSQSSVVVGDIEEVSETLINQPLESRIVSFTATKDSTFLYAVQNQASLTVKEFLPKSETERTLFTIPFREAAIMWGRSANDTHHIYPKAAAQLEGYLYRAENSKIERLPITGFGLTGAGVESFSVFGRQEAERYKTYWYNIDTAETNSIQFPFLPEKCLPLSKPYPTLVCALSITEYGHNTPDSWYKGETIYDDDLWEITPDKGYTAMIANITGLSGRELDVVDLSANEASDHIFFHNKADRTLWVFERSLPPIPPAPLPEE